MLLKIRHWEARSNLCSSIYSRTIVNLIFNVTALLHLLIAFSQRFVAFQVVTISHRFISSPEIASCLAMTACVLGVVLTRNTSLRGTKQSIFVNFFTNYCEPYFYCDCSATSVNRIFPSSASISSGDYFSPFHFLQLRLLRATQ
ncbi:hypothetical protein ACVWYG_000804 [Pedobacter sp. UYEF25]